MSSPVPEADIAPRSRFGVRRRDQSKVALPSPGPTRLVLVVLFFVLLAALVVSVLMYVSRPPAWIRDLREATAQAGTNGDELRVDSVTDFAWDTVHVFGPYTEPARVTKGLGFVWGDGTIDGPDTEGLQLVVFVRDKEVVSSAQVSSCHPEFPLDERTAGGLTPAEAVFRLENHGWEVDEPDEPPRMHTCWRAIPLAG